MRCVMTQVGALQVLQKAVMGATAKDAAKAQTSLALPVAKAAMEPSPEVREASLQVRSR